MAQEIPDRLLALVRQDAERPDRGYGPYRLGLALAESALGPTLSSTRALLEAGRPADAFHELCVTHRFPRLGTAMGTKFLHFVDRSGRALILDSVVAGWLKEHTGLRFRCLRDEREYATWLALAEQWAAETGTTAERIELLMFTDGLPEGSPWRPDFTSDDTEFVRTPAMPAHQSDSSEQRAAEEAIRSRVAARLGKELRPITLKLGGGAAVQVDGAAVDESAFVEIFARQGPLKGGQRHKVATDALKLITIGRSRPDAVLIIAFADEQAASYAIKGTWMAEALATWRIQVLVVDLDGEVRDGIRSAQIRQQMVNPAAPAPADAELD